MVFATPRIRHATVTDGVGRAGPGPQSALQSKAAQALKGKVPRAMFTPRTSSSTVTTPSPLQSPMQVEGGVDAGEGVGVGETTVEVTHVQPAESISHLPRRHGAIGQGLPGVHGGQMVQVPPHGASEHAKSPGVTVGGGVGVGPGAASIFVTWKQPFPCMQIETQAGCAVPVTHTASPTWKPPVSLSR